MSYILATDRVALAIRQGKQTQDRRPVKPQPPADTEYMGMQVAAPTCIDAEPGTVFFRPVRPTSVDAGILPPWQPGDLLYVREAHAIEPMDPNDGPSIVFRADRGECFLDANWRQMTPAGYIRSDWQPRGKWRPNIHHCKAHARTWVRVKRVWAERVRDISDADAVAEAVPCWVCNRPFDGLSEEDCQCFHSTGMDGRCSAAESFEPFWESLYPGSWERNEWVWCREFEREEQGR